MGSTIDNNIESRSDEEAVERAQNLSGLLPTRTGVQVCDRPTRKPVVIDQHSLFFVLSLSDLFFAFQKVIPNNIIVA
jgi:hypothetical protein